MLLLINSKISEDNLKKAAEDLGGYIKSIKIIRVVKYFHRIFVKKWRRDYMKTE